jgi:sec-independent protein translocase protein TatA
MGMFSISHWLVVLLVIFIVFGAGRFPKAMGDLARGIHAFRAGFADENDLALKSDRGEAADSKPVRLVHADRHQRV